MSSRLAPEPAQNPIPACKRHHPAHAPAPLLRAVLLSTVVLFALPTLASAQESGAPESPTPESGSQDSSAQDAAAGVTPTPSPSIQIMPPPAEAPAPEAASGTAPAAPAITPAFGAVSTAAGTAAGSTSPLGSLTDIQACPYKQIRAAYDEAVTGKDVLDTLAVEREILILCDERNTLVAKLLEGEHRLAELLTPDRAQEITVTRPAGESAANPSTQLDRLNNTPGQTTAASPTTAPGGEQTEGTDPQLAQAGTNPALSPAPGQCEPLFATRYLSPGSAETGTLAQAGITDTASGTDLTVKVGDSLTGGYVVESITASGVTLSRNNQLLPLPGFDAPTVAEGFYAKAPGTDPDAGAEQTP